MSDDDEPEDPEFEKYMRGLHCGHVSFDQLARWHYDEKRETWPRHLAERLEAAVVNILKPGKYRDVEELADCLTAIEAARGRRDIPALASERRDVTPQEPQAGGEGTR